MVLVSKIFENKIAKMSTDELARHVGKLAVRKEAAYMTFARTRGIKNGEDYRRISAQYGYARTKLQLVKK
jgi:hypothetical protein